MRLPGEVFDESFWWVLEDRKIVLLESLNHFHSQTRQRPSISVPAPKTRSVESSGRLDAVWKHPASTKPQADSSVETEFEKETNNATAEELQLALPIRAATPTALLEHLPSARQSRTLAVLRLAPTKPTERCADQPKAHVTSPSTATGPHPPVHRMGSSRTEIPVKHRTRM
jgi:hypothetical protein